MGGFLGFILFVAVVAVCVSVRIVPEAHAEVIERLGKYDRTLESGLKFKIPFIERVAKRVTLKEQVADFPPQPVITKDNVTMQIDTVVYYQIVDPQAFAYGVEQPIIAIENLTATTLRNIIGDMDLDETLTSRDIVNTKLRAIVDEATDPWGIKVNRVELKNIMPPKGIQESMEKQMKAERERRETILVAEGEKKAAVLKAEAERDAAVLRAEAEKIQLVKEAEGHAESIRLHKEAEADGIVKLKEAEANGVKLLKDAGLTNEDIVKLKSVDAFSAAANGQATKIIIPSEIQGLVGLANGITESASATTVK